MSWGTLLKGTGAIKSKSQRAKPAGGAGAAGGAGEALGPTGMPKNAAEARVQMERTFKEGWLQKSNPEGNSWKKRWVVVDLVKQTLSWYQAEPRYTMVTYGICDKPKGTLSLKGAKFGLVDTSGLTGRSKPPSDACFSLETMEPARRTLFAARDEEHLGEWGAFVQQAVAGLSGKAGAKRRWALLAREMAKLKISMSAPPKKMSGWLRKSDATGHDWTVRWFDLDPVSRTLTYFEDDKMVKPKGIINLRAASMDIGHEDATMRTFPVFSISVPERKYQLMASTQEVMQDWCDSMQGVIRAAEAAAAAAKTGRPTPREGYLLKCGAGGKVWSKRWCKYDPASKSVGFYEREDRTETAKALVVVPGLEIHTGTKKVKAPKVFVLVLKEPSGGTTHYLCADNAEDLSGWYDTLLLGGATEADPSTAALAEEKSPMAVVSGVLTGWMHKVTGR